MKKNIFILILSAQLVLPAYCENFFFNDTFFLKKNTNNEKILSKYQFYPQGEDLNKWLEKINIEVYKTNEKPLDKAKIFDKEIEKNKNIILLKYVQSKIKNCAIITYLEPLEINNENYIIYHIVKYYNLNNKKLSIIDYNRKYKIDDKIQIKLMCQNIKQNINDDIEKMIILEPNDF